MWGDYLSPRIANSARGYFNLGAVAANFSVVGLFNNSPGQHYLRIFDVSMQAPSGFIQSGMVSGNVGSLSAAAIVHNCLPSQQIIGIGTFNNGATSLTFTTSYQWAQNTNYGVDWNHEFPAVCVPPGYSMLFAPAVVNTAIQLSLWWDWIEAGDWLTGHPVEHQNVPPVPPYTPPTLPPPPTPRDGRLG